MASMSDYMQKKKINIKLYKGLLEKLDIIENINSEDENLRGLELSISISLKTGSPYIKVEKDDPDFTSIQPLVTQIIEDINGSEFHYIDEESKFGAYFIYFTTF